MADASKAVKSLRSFYKDRYAEFDVPELLSELEGTNDRAAIIILCAFLDDAFEFALAKKMRKLTPTEHTQAFRFDGPLGSFSNRIEMSHHLKIIDDSLRDRLNDLREMRNACAHSKRGISLKTPQLLNVCKRVMQGAKVKVGEESPEAYRAALAAECFYIYNRLVHSKAKADRQFSVYARAIRAARTII